jgi:hypothetical protein
MICSARVDQRLPCGGIRRMIVPERRQRRPDHGLLLRADIGGRHGDRLGRDFTNAGFQRKSCTWRSKARG